MFKKLLFGGAGTNTVIGDIGILIMRVFMGLTFCLAHGLMKIQDPTIAITSARRLKFPVPEAFGWAATFSEFLGGLLLALGLLTRPSAFFLACTMIVAAFMAHGPDPFGKKELALVYLVAMVFFLCAGGGRFSIDALISKGAK